MKRYQLSVVDFLAFLGTCDNQELGPRVCHSSFCQILLQIVVRAANTSSPEALTLLADSVKRIQAFDAKCLRKLLRISYLEHKTSQ